MVCPVDSLHILGHTKRERKDCLQYLMSKICANWDLKLAGYSWLF